MSVAINPAYWPESVAFKRLVRDLTRQANYVPPYQDNAAPPTGLAAAAAEETPEQPAGSLPVVRIGPWVLEAADNGDLIARHDTGTVRTIATVQEGPDHG